jgi:hypothetical protein
VTSKIRTIALLLAILSPARALAQVDEIDTLAIRAHTYFLAHDLLAGRGTGSRGAHLAAAYIVSQCQRLGLAPIEGRYLLPVPLESAKILPSTRLVAAGPRGKLAFLYPSDFTPNVGSKETLRGFAGMTAFVGGEADIAAGKARYLDLAGAVAVTVGPVRGAAADTLAARGVVGMLHLIGTDDGYELYLRSRGTSRLYHREPDVRSSFLPEIPSVLVGPRMARVLLSSANVTRDGEIPTQTLEWRITYELAVERTTVYDANVGCLLEGSDPLARDTAIALTAHFDHLGVGLPDGSADSIYNGFSDNAAGVGMLLAVAEALRQHPEHTPRHSVLFLFLTGEERGLLGADYFVARPAWPLARFAAVVNLDAGAPPARPVSWRLAGGDGSALGTLAKHVADRQGWQLSTSPAQPNSDYFPFHREGVPAGFIVPGPEPYEGLTADSSKALRARWDHYHQLGDEWASDFPFAGLGRYAEFALLLVREVDEGPAR